MQGGASSALLGMETINTKGRTSIHHPLAWPEGKACGQGECLAGGLALQGEEWGGERKQSQEKHHLLQEICTGLRLQTLCSLHCFPGPD